MYHFENETFFFFFNLEILERKKLGLFEKVTRKFNAPISKIFFFIEKFSLFLERFGNLDFFFFFFLFLKERKKIGFFFFKKVTRKFNVPSSRNFFKLT